MNNESGKSLVAGNSNGLSRTPRPDPKVQAGLDRILAQEPGKPEVIAPTNAGQDWNTKLMAMKLDTELATAELEAIDAEESLLSMQEDLAGRRAALAIRKAKSKELTELAAKRGSEVADHMVKQQITALNAAADMAIGTPSETEIRVAAMGKHQGIMRMRLAEAQ